MSNISLGAKLFSINFRPIRNVGSASFGQKWLSKRPIPFWLEPNGSVAAFNYPITGVLPLQVQMQLGSPTSAKVALYNNKSNVCITSGKPDANGLVTFANLVPGRSDYFAVCEVPGSYNMQIYSQLTPT